MAAATVTLRLDEEGAGEFTLSRDALEDCKEMADLKVSYITEDEEGFPITAVRWTESLYRIRNVAAYSFPESLALMEFHAQKRKEGLSAEELAQADRKYLEEERKVTLSLITGMRFTLKFLGHPASDTLWNMFVEHPNRPRLMSEVPIKDLEAWVARSYRGCKNPPSHIDPDLIYRDGPSTI